MFFAVETFLVKCKTFRIIILFKHTRRRTIPICQSFHVAGTWNFAVKNLIRDEEFLDPRDEHKKKILTHKIFFYGLYQQPVYLNICIYHANNC